MRVGQSTEPARDQGAQGRVAGYLLFVFCYLPKGGSKERATKSSVVASCLWGFILLGLAVSAGGCASAVSAGSNTALDGIDLVKMTDQMAASISGNAAVQRIIATHGPMTIVVQPVMNLMTAAVLPRGQADAFTARVRSLLSKHAPEEFVWVMNRDAFYSLRNQELNVDLGPEPERVQPEYALTAKFQSLVHETKNRRSDYYLCVYELTNLKSGDLIWSDKYEVKKTAVGGMLG
jgi:PBP1b-binding outer membrane lipoprotein LpoB